MPFYYLQQIQNCLRSRVGFIIRAKKVALQEQATFRRDKTIYNVCSIVLHFLRINLQNSVGLQTWKLWSVKEREGQTLFYHWTYYIVGRELKLTFTHSSSEQIYYSKSSKIQYLFQFLESRPIGCAGWSSSCRVKECPGRVLRDPA